MKRLSLLFFSLALAGPALALDPAAPVAPDPAAAPVEAIDVRGLSLALLFSNAADDFKVCLDNSQVIADLQGVIQDDLRLYGLGTSAFMSTTSAFSAEEKAAAARLAGFAPPVRDGLEKDIATMSGQVMEVLQKNLGEAKDPARLDALRSESADLRQRINTGQLRATPEDVRTACIGVAVLAASKDRGPMAEMYRPYLKELTAEYTAYRSPEGYLAARWGMTPPEVAKAEGVPVATLTTGKLVRIDGSPAKATYLFTDGRLSEVVVTFVPGCNAQACLNRYRTVNNLLVEKYGDGKDYSSTDDQALAESTSMLYEGLGRERYPWRLIEEGYSKEEHGWQTGESLVIHQLRGGKKPLQKGRADLVHTVRYLSYKFLPRANYLQRQQEEAEKKKRLKNL